jgi:hypothetical protein
MTSKLKSWQKEVQGGKFNNIDEAVTELTRRVEREPILDLAEGSPHFQEQLKIEKQLTREANLDRARIQTQNRVAPELPNKIATVTRKGKAVYKAPGIGLKDVKNLLIGRTPTGTAVRGLAALNIAGSALQVKAGTGALDKTKSSQERLADALEGGAGIAGFAGLRGNIPAGIAGITLGALSGAVRNRLQRDARRERDQQIMAGEIQPSIPDNLTIKQWDPEQERVDAAMQLQINR